MKNIITTFLILLTIGLSAQTSDSTATHVILDGRIFNVLGNWTAAQIPIVDAGALITATDVEGALQEAFTNLAPKNSPTLVTPVLGVATATSINGVVLTSGSVNGTLTGSNTGDQTITLTGDVTGSGTGSFATTIAADAVDESMLNMFNAPTDEYYLKYDSTNGMTWALGSGGGDIYLHPNSDVAIDSIYVGTTAQIAARPLGTDVLSFATDASIELTDLTDVNTATVTNRNVLVADGVDFESRALVALDVSDLPSSTTTFTNKRITRRVNTIASSATPTPAGDTTDIFTVTALAAAATFAAPTGTPTDGQSLVIRIKDNATARTLAWNAIYRAGSDFALPTTTVISETIYLQFIYNSADSKWDAVGLTQGF